MNKSDNFFNACLIILILITLIISGLNPYDRTTWLLEVFPVLIALPILIFTHKKYPLTRLIYPNNLGRFINLVKKTASQSTGYFSLLPLTNHINAHIRT